MYMSGNFIMLNMDELRQVITEIVEGICDRNRQNEVPSVEKTSG